MTFNFDLDYIAAPMVNQSDTPFRTLVHNHGATLTYTEMLKPARLLSDPDYLAFHRRALELGRSSSTGPVIVQVCGNDQEVIVRGAKTVVDLCDGIGMWSRYNAYTHVFLMHFSSDADLNLGCPQDIAREEHFGAYLLGKKDWPVVQGIGEQNKVCRNILRRFDMATQSRLSRTHYLSPSPPNYVFAVRCHPRSRSQVISKLQARLSSPCTHVTHLPAGEGRAQPTSPW
jgi:hypothetical protein